MSLYYDDGRGIKIFCGDCREILPTLESDSIDCILTDPPFFMPATHYQSRVEWQRSWSDTSILGSFWSSIVDASVRVLKPTGHMLAFCNGDSYPVFYPEAYRRFDFLKSLVWDKGHVGLGRVWRNQHELVLAARWNESEFVEDGELRADVFRFSATRSQEREHPVEKPVDMLIWLMAPCCANGATVLDPFCGSGTTLEAAKRIGHNAIGIEGEERYCEIAARRLSQQVLDFAPKPKREPEQASILDRIAKEDSR